MKGQKDQSGQSVVEFAFVLPFFFFLVVGMIYGGFAYADYLQYNNAVRGLAREISVQTDEQKRAELVSNINNGHSDRVTPLTNLYTATLHAELDPSGYVQVRASFNLNYDVDFLPISDLQCTMPLEGSGE